MKWERKFYFDKVLSVRGRSSPFIFDSVSAAVEWICINNYLIEVLMHRLDDFLSVESPDKEPTALVFLKQIFQYLGVPLAPDIKYLAPPRSWNFWVSFLTPS